MKILSTILLACFILFSFKSFSQKDGEFKIVINDYYGIFESLKPICESISRLDSLRLEFYQVEDSDSNSLFLYNQLRDSFPTYVVYALTHHESPMVKFFSYCILNKDNKVLLMQAIRENEKDTSVIPYLDRPYYFEIFKDNPPLLMYLVVEMVYWSYMGDDLSITLTEKDMKYVSMLYAGFNKQIVKSFKPFKITYKGKIFRSKFGWVVKPGDDKLYKGNYYYLYSEQGLKDFKNGENVEVTGEVRLSTWFRKWREPAFGTTFFVSGNEYLVKYILVEKLVRI